MWAVGRCRFRGLYLITCLLLDTLPFGSENVLRQPASACILPQILFGQLRLDVAILTMLYSIAGLGIAIVNDFKSIKGRVAGEDYVMLPPCNRQRAGAVWICVLSAGCSQSA